jgi:hypothetical protein
MAFWTNWLAQVTGLFLENRTVELNAVVLRNADDTNDILQGNGSGAANVNIVGGSLPVPVGGAIEARQASSTLITPTPKTAPLSPAAAECIVPGSTPCNNGVLIQADLANTGIVYVGGTAVAAGQGMQLRKGDSMFVRVTNANLLYCVGTAAGDKLQLEVT